MALIVTALIKGYVYFIDPPTPLEMNVPIQTRNLIPGLSVSSIVPNRVELLVNGSKSRIERLRERDIKVIADCSRINTEGEHTIKVHLSHSKLQGVRYQIIPETVNISIGKFEQRFFPPEMKITGAMPGNRVISSIEGLPDTVKLSGSINELEKVNNVVYELNVEQTQSAWKTTVTFQPVDINGRLIEHLQTDPESADITVTTSENMGKKSVPVIPIVTGTPAINYSITSQEINPNYVEITGDPEAIQSVNSINTQEIRIEGSTSAITRTVSLTSPKAGIVINPQNVQVKINIGQISSQRSVQVFVEIRGQKENFSYRLDPPRVTIWLQGPVDKLKDLELNLVKATFDASSYGPGVHTVKLPKPNLPSSVAFFDMNPSEAVLSVTERDNSESRNTENN
jgi:YbbR domain-containing protein